MVHSPSKATSTVSLYALSALYRDRVGARAQRPAHRALDACQFRRRLRDPVDPPSFVTILAQDADHVVVRPPQKRRHAIGLGIGESRFDSSRRVPVTHLLIASFSLVRHGAEGIAADDKPAHRQACQLHLFHVHVRALSFLPAW